MKYYLKQQELMGLAGALAQRIDKYFKERPALKRSIYPIPRGGVPVAYMLSAVGLQVSISDNPNSAELFVDDLIESGATSEAFTDNFNKPVMTLIDKRLTRSAYHKKWLVFPWEETAVKGAEDHIVRLLQYVGEDSRRGGLLETPKRALKAWDFWTSGYDQDPKAVLKVFEDGAENVDQMVMVKDIPLYSHCEHHMAAIFGTCTVAYIPNGKIVGLSKLSRLVNIFARRLQVQERLTNQIADALQEHLNPLGVGVQIKARHMCMESRGVCQQGHHTITTALHGAMKTEASTRSEFLEGAR